jgi:hypothetical protein
MDETALLALGILMEEVCRETLGETGDMVFTEGEPKGDYSNTHPFQEAGQSAVSTSEAAVKSGRTRTGKRRRLDVDAAAN